MRAVRLPNLLLIIWSGVFPKVHLLLRAVSIKNGIGLVFGFCCFHILLLLWNNAKGLVTLTTARDEIQFKVNLRFRDNEQLISVCGYTWKLGCSLTIFHHVGQVFPTFFPSRTTWHPVLSTHTTYSRKTNFIESEFIQKNIIHENNNKRPQLKFNEFFVFGYLQLVGRCGE